MGAVTESTVESATLWSAFQQLQTYQAQIPTLGRLARVVLSSLAYRNRQDPLPGDLARELFCEWCDYHSLCRFDPSVDAHQYRRRDPMAEETVWGILQGEREG